MNQFQKELYWAHKDLSDKLEKNEIFLTEVDMKEKRIWSKSDFNFGSVCRNVLTILRTLGRTREVRVKGNTLFIIL